MFILLVCTLVTVARAGAPEENISAASVASSEYCNVVIDIHVMGDFIHGYADYYDGTKWVSTDLRVISNFFTVKRGTVITVSVAAWIDQERTDVYTNSFSYYIDSDEYIAISAYY